jgi:pyruvate formate lyase activating enzyme
VSEQTGPEEVVVAAQRTGCRSIACTYTGPTIFFKYVDNTVRLAHEADLANVCVTNGSQ